MASVGVARLGFVLDLDPELGAGIPAPERELVEQACRGALLRVPRGRWQPGAAGQRDRLLGLVILEGVLCREVAVSDRHVLELLGPGDVVQLPVGRTDSTLASPVALTAATELLLVGLGRSFLRAAERWPMLLAEVLRRIEAQRERYSIQSAIVHLPRAEDRLLLLLWHLAQRWGRTTPQGTLLRIPLTHDVLGQLIAARRPTVTQAVGKLAQQHYLTRLDDGAWLLSDAAAMTAQLIARSDQQQKVIGESVRLHQLTRETRDDARALRGEATQIRRKRHATAPQEPAADRPRTGGVIPAR